MSMRESHPVEGHVSRGFEAVREVFADNFAGRRELGGACCAYHHGEKVVDLWGGIRNKETGEPWEQDTMVIVYSATKGLAAMTLAVAHSRGWLDYEERVAHVLARVRAAGQRADHRAPTARPPGRAVRARRARRSRASSPTSIGSRSCWRVRSPRGSPERVRRITPSRSGSTKASCCGASIRGIAAWDSSSRTRSRHRSGWTSTSGCPRTSRTPAWPRLRRPGWIEMLHGFPLRLDARRDESSLQHHRALRGSELPHDEQRVYARNFEVPSGGAVGTARAIAHAYSVFATGGRELGLRPETLDLLAAPAVPPARGFYDECMKGDGIQFSLGFMKPARPAVWQRQFVRVTRRRWRARLCRSGGGGWLRIRDKQDGDATGRRPAGCGAPRRALLLPSGSASRLGTTRGLGRFAAGGRRTWKCPIAVAAGRRRSGCAGVLLTTAPDRGPNPLPSRPRGSRFHLRQAVNRAAGRRRRMRS